jgi:hypothetical protein
LLRDGFVDVGVPFGSGRGGGTPQIPRLRYALSKNISTKGPRNRRSLGFARDDKGNGYGSVESGCWTEAFFITLGGRRAHDSFGRDDKKERVAERRGPLPRAKAVVGAVGTSISSPFCAKSKKSQALGMTKEEVVEGERTVV